MRRINILIAVMVMPLLLAAASPERILPKTLVIKSKVWYAEQREAWALLVQSEPRNSAAWLNLYAASLFSHASKDVLDNVVVTMERNIPNTFEYWLVKSWHGGFNGESYNALSKAHSLKPEDVESYSLLQLFAEFALDSTNRARFSRGLYEGSQISPALLNYSYNVLMSLERSAILITEGESTTIPLFVLQDVLGVRQDVVILDLDMLASKEYRDKKFPMAQLQYTNIDVEHAGSAWICAQLPTQNPDRKFYYALTLGKENIQAIKEYLYVVGLASRHSVNDFDNISAIRRNIEKEFLLDYLQVDFNGQSDSDAGHAFSANYLLPMVLLYEDYLREGNLEQGRKIWHLVEKIARETGKQDVIAAYLNAEITEEIPYFPFAIEVKSWEDNFKPISTTLYAANSETTNLQYNRFLEYLKVNKLNDLYEKYKFDFSRYEEPALAFMLNYSTPRTETKKEKFFNHYPAVNISYEAANAYCNWLTVQYNQAADRKFKKVKFRLPSLDEWQIAAAGIKNPTSWKLAEQQAEVKITPAGAGLDKNAQSKMVSLSDPEILYPWFRFFGLRNSPRNTKDCYLGNFKSEPCNCPGYKGQHPANDDGFAMMGPVRTYFPNDAGLFDVVGNVAEMINQKGMACGGSWNHAPAESTIRSINEYNYPDASTGFRVFMEIIEK
jgi:hypothetical protein